MRKLNKSNYEGFFMNNQNIMFGYNPHMEELKKSKNVNQLVFINVQNVFIVYPFQIKEYNLFIQNTESSLEQ